MRLRFLPVLVGIVVSVFSIYGQVSDDFVGNQLKSSWNGDVSKFSVSFSNLCLSDAGNSATAYLSTYSTAMDDCAWMASLQLNFCPSSANFVRIYLTSDNIALNDALNGYYLQIGSSKKQVLLYRMKNKTSQKLGESVENRVNLSDVKLSVKVMRSKEAEWKVYTKLDGETDYTMDFSVVDSTFLTSSFTGIYCKYTKTNAQKISFDKFVVSGKSVVDDVAPKVKKMTMTDSLLTLTFDEWVDKDNVEISSNPNVDFSMEWAKSQKSVVLRLNEELYKGTRYELSVSNLTDYVGNVADDTILTYAMTEEAEPQDILFTEVLFNAQTDGSEFAEIINVSDKVIDLSTLKFSTRKSSDSSLYSAKKISSESLLIFPEEIKVLTGDINGVTSFYDSKNGAFIELSSFPSLRNENGAIVLFKSKDSTIIDEFYYESDMHVESVPNKGKGVSLERISLESDEWTSAVAINGYATPGYWSQGESGSVENFDFTLSANEICYPYKDAENHFHISYAFDAPNYLASLKIYTVEGRCVRTLLNNESLAVSGDIEWNGCDDSGDVLSVAPYVAVIEVHNPANGWRTRRAFVVLLSK